MVKLFLFDDTPLESNGDVVLRPLKAQVHLEDNGDYYLNLECGLEYVNLIIKDNIIVVNTPEGEQAFRIGNVEKTKTRITTKAWHVYYDTENYVIADTYIVNKNCENALEQLNNHTESTTPFLTSSDITKKESFRCVRKSLKEAIDVVLERWGGHLVRENFIIEIQSSIGSDKGVTVRYGKNIKDISCVDNWDDVVTKILPVGRDGTLLNAVDPNESIYISSLTQYNQPYTKVIDFEQEIEAEDYETEEEYLEALVDDLRSQAVAYLNINCVPKVSYTLKAHIDRDVALGDVIKVQDERLGIDIMTQVVGYDYDCILEKYTEISFGNFEQKLSDLLPKISAQANANAVQIVQSATDPIKTSVELVNNKADSIVETLTDSYVIYDGSSIMIVDALPKEDAQNIISIDMDGISFSNDGLSGFFRTVWSIDGTLMPQDNEVLADYIMQEGATSGWSWKKYTSGACELFRTLSFDAGDLTWATFNTTLFTALASFNYPFNVTDAFVVATLNDQGSSIGWIAQAQSTSNSQGSLRIISEANTGTILVNVAIKGKWR